MTTTYAITDRISGHYFGTYEAETEAEALDKLAQDAGYADYRAACEVVGGRGELIVEQTHEI